MQQLFNYRTLISRLQGSIKNSISTFLAQEDLRIYGKKTILNCLLFNQIVDLFLSFSTLYSRYYCFFQKTIFGSHFGIIFSIDNFI